MYERILHHMFFSNILTLRIRKLGQINSAYFALFFSSCSLQRSHIALCAKVRPLAFSMTSLLCCDTMFFHFLSQKMVKPEVLCIGSLFPFLSYHLSFKCKYFDILSPCFSCHFLFHFSC